MGPLTMQKAKSNSESLKVMKQEHPGWPWTDGKLSSAKNSWTFSHSVYFFGAPLGTPPLAKRYLQQQEAMCCILLRCLVRWVKWKHRLSRESRATLLLSFADFFYILPSVYHFWLEEKWNSSCVSSLFRTESVDLRESFQEEPVNFLCFKIVNFLHKIFSNPSVGDSFQSSCVKE